MAKVLVADNLSPRAVEIFKARGIETYLQGLHASDKESMETAARENATTMKTLSKLDDELKKILKGLSENDDDEESLKLAHAVQGSLVGNMKPVQGHVVKCTGLGHQSAHEIVGDQEHL